MSSLFNDKPNIESTWVCENKNSNRNCTAKKFLRDYFKEKTQSPYWVIVQKNTYHHTKIILNHVFTDKQKAYNIIQKIEELKSQYNGWDWNYHKLPTPELSWKEKKLKLGCRYDGEHYIDCDYILLSLDYRWAVTLNKNDNRPRCGNIHYVFDLEKHLDELMKNVSADVKAIHIEEKILKNHKYAEIQDFEFKAAIFYHQNLQDICLNYITSNIDLYTLQKNNINQDCKERIQKLIQIKDQEHKIRTLCNKTTDGI